MTRLKHVLARSGEQYLYTDFNRRMERLLKAELRIDREITDAELVAMIVEASRLYPVRLGEIRNVAVEIGTRKYRDECGGHYQAHRALASVPYDGSAALLEIRPPDFAWSQVGQINATAVKFRLVLPDLDPTNAIVALEQDLVRARMAVKGLDALASEFNANIRHQIPIFVESYARHWRANISLHYAG